MGSFLTKTVYVICRKDEILAITGSKTKAEVIFRALTEKNFTLYKLRVKNGEVLDQTLLLHSCRYDVCRYER